MNKTNETEKQVKTIIHELVRIGEEHDSWRENGLLWHPDEPRGDYEKHIETHTEEFYRRNPPLVGRIRRMLLEVPN